MTDKKSGKQRFDYYEGNPEGFHIYSWCPTPEPTVPPTQVHMHIPVAARQSCSDSRDPARWIDSSLRFRSIERMCGETSR